MTPQLQQAIKLLQFSSVELREFVEGELQENPMLERDESSGSDRRTDDRALEDTTAGSAESGTTETGDEPSPPDTLEFATGEATTNESESPLDIDHDTVWEGESPTDAATAPSDTNGMDSSLSLDRFSAGAGGRTDFTTPMNDIEATLSEDKSLRDHLTEQLLVDLTDARDRMIGRHLIESLDQSGWIVTPLPDVAQMLGCSEQRVERVLQSLQKFDPPGIFARDLKECLALQLQ
ncbi:MAG TPA: RNA polymerase sigma-54 factor, partial [Rhodospirillaceae bacterium]|nr:RNA polymerase sigma-54 factor [Rhodospirillaceae bacterium]